MIKSSLIKKKIKESKLEQELESIMEFLRMSFCYTCEYRLKNPCNICSICGKGSKWKLIKNIDDKIKENLKKLI